jgi:hypothetical protein
MIAEALTCAESTLAQARERWRDLETNHPSVRRAREFIREHQTLLLMLIILKWAIGLLVAKCLLVG